MRRPSYSFAKKKKKTEAMSEYTPIPPTDFATESQSLRQLPPETLLSEIARLQNSTNHLRRSNVELMEFDPDDPDFVRAVEENRQVIARQDTRIETMLSVIGEVLGEAAESAVRSTMLTNTVIDSTSARPALWTTDNDTLPNGGPILSPSTVIVSSAVSELQTEESLVTPTIVHPALSERGVISSQTLPTASIEASTFSASMDEQEDDTGVYLWSVFTNTAPKTFGL